MLHAQLAYLHTWTGCRESSHHISWHICSYKLNCRNNLNVFLLTILLCRLHNNSADHWLKHNLIHNRISNATPSDTKYNIGIKRIFEHCSLHNSQSPNGGFVICPYSSKDALNNKHIIQLWVPVTTMSNCATSKWSRRTSLLEYHRSENSMNTYNYSGNTCWRPLIATITSWSCSYFKIRRPLETMARLKNFLKVTLRS
jgi:hypothetical protein